MNNKILIGLAVGVSVVLLGLNVLGLSGIRNALIALRLNPNIENKVLGNTYSNPTIAQASMTESSTTTVSLLNSDGSNRVITGIDVFFNPDDAAGNGVATGTWSNFGGSFNFDIATGTTAFVTSTPNTGSPFGVNNAFSTSTAVQWFTTTTYTNVNARIWHTGEYLNMKVNKAASSTGFMSVKYYNL